jgi:hypothetical protein
MEPSFRIAQVEFLLTQYTDAVHRSGMGDLAIWQSLESIYTRPDDWDLVLTSTREEAFDRMVKDNWHVDMGDHFFGIDYETVDELVLKYIKDNKLVKDINDEEDADA